MKSERKVRRTFSVSFKKEKVKLIEQGTISVRELGIIYEVTPTAIYKWIRKYSSLAKTERIVVEKISEEAKNKELLVRIGELERAVGKKQLELDYYKSAIEMINEEEGEDILKKYRPKQWPEHAPKATV